MLSSHETKQFGFFLLYYDTFFISLHQKNFSNIVIGLFTEFYEHLITQLFVKTYENGMEAVAGRSLGRGGVYLWNI